MKKAKMKKNKSKSISIGDITKPVAKFLKRFHTIVFFLIVSGLLFIAIAVLLPITSLSTEVAPSAGQKIDGAFDQTTIDRLEKKGASSNSSYEPGERKSPFVE